MQLVTVDRFRERVSNEADIVALCGAGISIPPPTSLPSGNALRDLCVVRLLRDDQNADLVDRLLGSPAFQALLPEAALQEVGFFAQDHIDRLISTVLSRSPANNLHRAIAERFAEVFTTNFDKCFELAGARDVHHLHGSVDRPHTLQSGRWRLGKTAEDVLGLLKRRAETSTIFVSGYSFRDIDICGALAGTNRLKLMYLSHTDEIPPMLYRMPGEVTCAVGPLESVLPQLPLPQSRDQGFEGPLGVRQPRRAAKALSLMYLFGALGEVELLSETFRLYRPDLRGRDRLRASGALADTLRGAQKFSDAYAVCLKEARLRSYKKDANLDLQSYLLTLMGLCEHEGAAHLERARSLLLQALGAMNRFGLRDHSPETPARVAVWRAKVANNLGNVERDRGRVGRAQNLYRLSIETKLTYGEESAAAQTRSNLSVLKIGLGEHDEASAGLALVVEAMKKSPEVYICRSAIYDNAIALLQSAGLPTERVTFGSVGLDEIQQLLTGEGRLTADLQAILDSLRELQEILSKLGY